MKPLDMIEIIDGVLVSEDKVIMKVREPELFPDELKPFFQNKTKIQQKRINFGLSQVTVRHLDKSAIFDSGMFDYIKDHVGRIDYYLSNVAFPGEYKTFPLFARYRHGWICLSPLEV